MIFFDGLFNLILMEKVL